MFETHLHPFLSSFPFVLITLALVAEIYAAFRPERGLNRYVFLHLLLAVVMIIAAFLSGYIAAPEAQRVLGRSEQEISFHHLWGKGVLILSIGALALQWISARARFNKTVFSLFFRQWRNPCLLTIPLRFSQFFLRNELPIRPAVLRLVSASDRNLRVPFSFERP